MSRRLAMCASLAVVALGALAPSALAANPVQLSLGDSWGAGVGSAAPATGGYVPRLNEALREGFSCSPSGKPKPNQGCKRLELVNLSVGGATTPSLIAGQLPQAQQILAERNGNQNPRDDVEVVTVSIGGNDVFGPVVAACTPPLGGPGPACFGTIGAELAAYQADLASLLGSLRGAAGADARIVLGTYDNAIVGSCPIAAVPGGTALGAGVLEGFGPGPLANGLHDVMRAVAPAFGVEIAEVFGDLDPNADWTGDCLHPNDAGHQKVANAFADVLVD